MPDGDPADAGDSADETRRATQPPDPADVAAALAGAGGGPVDSVERVDQGTNAVFEAVAGGDRLVVKVGTATPDRVRVEGAATRLVARRTPIPVPAVHGTLDADALGAPALVVDHVTGRSRDGRPDDLPGSTVRAVARTAGRHLAALHDAVSLDGVGPLVAEGADDVPAPDGLAPSRPAGAWPDLYRDAVERQLGLLADTRFEDQVPAVRGWLDGAVERLRERSPPDPALAHMDYRWGNLRLRQEGDDPVAAVLDWGGVAGVPPAYELAHTGAVLARWGDPDRRDDRLAALREGYVAAGGDPAAVPDGDAARPYRLAARLRLVRHVETEVGDRGPAAVAARADEHRAALSALLAG